ncbi:ecotin family protein [Testudinibacter sp. P27/CKL/0425]
MIAEKAGLKDCNTTWYNAEFASRTLQGWGYIYYTVGNIRHSSQKCG